MNWFERLRHGFISGAQMAHKQSQVASMIAYHHTNKPVWTPRRFDRLSQEGYQKNVIVYRCVNLIARGIASVPWRLYDRKGELLNHPILDLLHQPNPMQGGSAFMEQVASYLLLAGNSYIEAVNRESPEKAEFYTLRPDRIKIIPSLNGLPKGYEYTVADQKTIIPHTSSQGGSSVLHLKMFNPLNDWYGQSPLEAAAASIDQHNAVASHNLSLLQNGGRPTGALLVRNRNLTQEQRETLRSDMTSLYEGERNAGRVMVLEGEFQWQELGLSPKDLDFIEGKNLSAREITQAFNVPPLLVGVPGDSTYANYQEARYHLWEDTILPILDYIVDEFNRWFVSSFGENLKLSYDIDAIPALASRREDAWAKISAANFLTINEKRRAVGYGEIEGGDTLSAE